MRSRGFSLIELLIVVAIILIVSAIAIPNLIRARIRANEASAASALRSINTAQGTYIISFPELGYADTLAKLGAPTDNSPINSDHSALLDWLLGCAMQPCTKSGYRFAVINANGPPVTDYEATAVPSVLHRTGDRGFCTQQLSQISVDPAGGTNCTTMLD